RILEPRAKLTVGRAGFRLVAAACGQGGDDVGVTFVVGGDERDATAGAMMVDQPVMRERVQPGREFGAGLVTGAHADQIHPYVLEKLLGDAGVAALTQQIAIDATLVAGVEGIECRGVAGRIGEHQVLVAGIGMPAHRATSMPAACVRNNRPPARKAARSLARPCAPPAAARLPSGIGAGRQTSRIQCGSGVNRPRSGNGSGCQRATRGAPTGTPCASKFWYES